MRSWENHEMRLTGISFVKLSLKRWWRKFLFFHKLCFPGLVWVHCTLFSFLTCSCTHVVTWLTFMPEWWIESESAPVWSVCLSVRFRGEMKVLPPFWKSGFSFFLSCLVCPQCAVVSSVNELKRNWLMSNNQWPLLLLFIMWQCPFSCNLYTPIYRYSNRIDSV